jgi:uncharacterized protein (TIGR04255 family)
MTARVLRNKPLVEAIFELRWELEEPAPGLKRDPHYKILVGSIYDNISDDYPFHQQLPTAVMPDEIAAYVVQHQFRKGKNEWPLIQIGPGVVTLNDTNGYIWEDFEKRILRLTETLFEVYPNSENLTVNTVLLRYIDAINFDYQDSDIFEFLKAQMKMNISVYPKLFEDTGVSELPTGFDLNFSFPSEKPKGALHLRFTRGQKKGADVLMWETIVQSVGDDVPKAKDKIPPWLELAHDLTSDWFFKIIEGDLLRRFE